MNKIILYVIGIVIVLYGIYSFFKLDILKHIMGYYEFSFGRSSLLINVMQYMGIFLGFSIITYKTCKLIKNEKEK